MTGVHVRVTVDRFRCIGSGNCVYWAPATFELDDELTVGRSPGCGVPTTYDVYSSTLHARLFRRGDQLWVEDLESTNGTFVNSERITKPVRLGKGDLLQVGSTVFEVTR